MSWSQTAPPRGGQGLLTGGRSQWPCDITESRFPELSARLSAQQSDCLTDRNTDHCCYRLMLCVRASSVRSAEDLEEEEEAGGCGTNPVFHCEPSQFESRARDHCSKHARATSAGEPLRGETPHKFPVNCVSRPRRSHAGVNTLRPRRDGNFARRLEIRRTRRSRNFSSRPGSFLIQLHLTLRSCRGRQGSSQTITYRI